MAERAQQDDTWRAPRARQEEWAREDERLSLEEQERIARESSKSMRLPIEEFMRHHVTEELVPFDRVRRTPFLFDRAERLERYPSQFVIDGTTYRVVKELGKGGFSIVLEVEVNEERSATHAGEPANITRVLKLIPMRRRSEEQTRMFERLLANEMDAHDFEGTYVGVKRYRLEDSTQIYALLLEKGEGASLQDMQQDTPLLFTTPYGQLLLTQSAGAVVRQLRAMKRHGWTHRDVKPGNVIVDRQHPERSRLIDHGLSSEEGRRDDEAGGVRVISPLYAPSEVVRGRKSDMQMRDLYALALTVGSMLYVFSHKDSVSSDDVINASLSAGVPEHLRAMLDLRSSRRESVLRTAFDAPPVRELAQLVYNVVRPDDTEAQRLAFWRDHHIDADTTGRRIESLASEMEHWYQAKLVLDVAAEDASSFSAWKVRRLRKAFDAYGRAVTERDQTHVYMELVNTMEDLGFEDALRQHPEAIQDAWRAGIDAERAAFEKRGTALVEEEVPSAAAHVRRRIMRRSARHVG